MKNQTFAYLVVLIIALVLFTGISFGTPSRPVPPDINLGFETIAKGHASGIAERVFYSIYNSNDWEDIWLKMNSNILEQRELPEVDFDKYIVIAMFQGSKSSGGYDIEATKVVETNYTLNNVVRVTVKETFPGNDCQVTTIITSPYHIIKIPKTGKDINFLMTNVTKNCFGSGDSCTKYYECPDGTKVKECEPVEFNNSAECKCITNPASLCTSVPDSCTKYYECPDGTKVKECEPVEFNNSAECKCITNPASLCTSVPERDKVPVYLEQKFKLEQDQIAVVKDFNDMEIMIKDSGNGVTLAVSIPGGPDILKILNLNVGEKKQAFGTTITLIELYENNIASLLVTMETMVAPRPVQGEKAKPICNRIGTEDEGWYIGKDLIKKDKCGCISLCKAIGSKSEGWYNSCSGGLIKWDKCGKNEVDSPETDTSTIGVYMKERTVVISPSEEVIEIETGETFTEIKSEETALTKEKIAVEPESGKIIVASKSGVEKEIKYLPEEAKEKAMNYGKFENVEKIELKIEGENAIYEITGKKTKYILWIFPVSSTEIIKVDAETNEILD